MMSDATAKVIENCNYWLRCITILEVCVKGGLLAILHDPARNGLPLNDEEETYKKLTVFKQFNESKLKKVLYACQWDKICPGAGKTNTMDLDITSIVVLIRNYLGLPAPATGWNFEDLNVNDYCLIACVVRIREIRNVILGHGSHTDVMTQKDFDEIYQRIKKVLNGIGYTKMQLFENLKTSSLDPYTHIQINFIRDEQLKMESKQAVINVDFQGEINFCDDLILNLTLKHDSLKADVEIFKMKQDNMEVKQDNMQITQNDIRSKLNKLHLHEVTKIKVIFAGNPGAGKSTLLNCLMYGRAENPLQPKDVFKSGASFGSGETYQLDSRTLNGVTYMDTPGLSDIMIRNKAAQAITEALQQDGEYQIIFVVTLEAGRVRPEDITTMTMVLESAKEITHYGVIFNKLGKGVMNKMNVNNQAELLSQVSMQRDTNKPLPITFFYGNQTEMEDKDNVVKMVPDLENFLLTLLPIRVHKANVNAIPTETYEAMKASMKKELTLLKENYEALQKKIAEDQKHFEKKMESILKDAEERYNRQREQMEKDHAASKAQLEEVIKTISDNTKAISERGERMDERQMQQAQIDQEMFSIMMNQMADHHDRAMQAISNRKKRGCIIS